MASASSGLRLTFVVGAVALLVASGCSGKSDEASPSATAASVDPGKPATPYGPKADAYLYRAEERVGYVFFTAITPKEDTRAHLFAEPEFAGSEGVSDYYLSVVVDDSTWSTGSYARALAGKVEFVLADGSRYSRDAQGLPLDLQVKDCGVGTNEYYLRASLTFELPPPDAAALPLRVEATINTL